MDARLRRHGGTRERFENASSQRRDPFQAQHALQLHLIELHLIEIAHII